MIVRAELRAWDGRERCVTGLPGRVPVTYIAREVELGFTRHGYFALWFDVGEEGETQFIESKN